MCPALLSYTKAGRRARGKIRSKTTRRMCSLLSVIATGFYSENNALGIGETCSDCPAEGHRQTQKD